MLQLPLHWQLPVTAFNLHLLFLLSGHVELEEADVAVFHGIIAALLTVFPDEMYHV